MKKTSVLMSFVGSRDPFNQIDKTKGPILTLCESLRPDLVCLFPTKDVLSEKVCYENRAREIVAILQEKNPSIPVKIYPLNIQEDPTDFNFLLQIIPENFKNALEEIEKHRGGNLIVHINCASGTPQMAAVLYGGINSGHILAHHLWQVKNPSYCGNNREERVVEIKTTFLEEFNARQRLWSHLRNWDFRNMAEECRRISKITPDEKRKLVSCQLEKFFEVIHLVDLMRFEDAHTEMTSLVELLISYKEHGLEEFFVKIKEVEKYVAALAREGIKSVGPQKKGRMETPRNLTELFFNTKRCFDRGSYADVLSRFWRLAEGIHYHRLENKYKINPRWFYRSTNQQALEEIRKKYCARPRNISRKKINTDGTWVYEFLGLAKSQEILSNFFNDPVYAYIFKGEEGGKRSEVFLNIKNLRNQTIVAHGMASVGFEEAVAAIEIVETMLKKDMVPGTAKFIQEGGYLFSEKKLGEFLRFLE